MSDLKTKTAKGLGWGFADNLANTGITAIVTIILARILSPTEFGIIGMTAIFFSLAGLFTDSGFSTALIRKKNAGTEDFCTVFYTNLVLSVILYFILFFTAPYIALFFKTPILTKIIRVFGLSLISSAFTIVQRSILTREIDFKTQTIISLISSVLSGILGISLALTGFGVWSLVMLQLSKSVFISIFLWLFSKWKPSLLFSLSSFKEMFSFGSKLLTSSIISVIWTEIYSLIIGRVYDVSLLGQYTRADKFKSMITSNVGLVMQRVSYPILSTIQDEKERQLRVYRKVAKTTMIITFTSVFGLAAIAKSLVLVLIGSQWLPAVHYLQILCASGIFIPLLSNSINVINANGKSGMTLRLEIIKTVLAVGPILLGVFYTIEYMLFGLIASSFLSYIIYAYHVQLVIGYSVFQQFKDIFPSFFIALAMAVIVWLISFLSIPQWIILLLQLILGVSIIFFIYGRIYKSEEFDEIKNAVFGLIRKKGIHVK